MNTARTLSRAPRWGEGVMNQGEPDATSRRRPVHAGWGAILATFALALSLSPASAADDDRTIAALRMAHGRESNSMLRYRVYARRAELEGYAAAAVAFRAAQVAESVHAARHATALAWAGATPSWNVEPVVARTTAENLRIAAVNEREESEIVYRVLVEQIRGECQYDAMWVLRDAGRAEATHSALFERVRQAIAPAGGESSVWMPAAFHGDPDFPTAFVVCRGDGSVLFAPVPKHCPNCGSGCELFTEYEMPAQPSVVPQPRLAFGPVR